MMRTLLRFVLVTALLALSGCGFHLRGEVGMPFASLYLDAPNSLLMQELRRNLEMNKVRLTKTADEAEVVLHLSGELFDKQILTLGGTGRVNEFQLRYRLSLRAEDAKHNLWVTPEDMVLYRNYSYDDTKILAKEAEEALLVQSMRNDLVQQVVRRLSRSRPLPPSE